MSNYNNNLNGNIRKISLSERQTQVLNLISQGMAYKEIGYHLNISDNTVAYHVSVIKSKLGCKTSTSILAEALRHGLLNNQDSLEVALD